MDEANLSVKLVELRGRTSIFIDAEIDKDGDLVMSGQDLGEAPMKFWGDSDYEYWVHVPSNQKDRVILALLEKLYKDDVKAFSKFRDLLGEKGIPSEYGSYI
ncbi:MAG: hypothetical protein ACFFEF_06815 [Candidatus Thorarchaeota archaeon]